jgi:hypothetical protein
MTSAGASSGWLRRRLAVPPPGTPSRLMVIGAVSIFVLVGLGVVGFVVLGGRADALERARADTEQLVRVRAIRTSAVEANAAATNAYLAGGLEPPDQRAQYQRGLADAAGALAAAAEDSAAGEPWDLGEVNRALVRYSGLIEAARANNRQGFPVGAGYLRLASDELRSDVLPVLSRSADVLAERVLDDRVASDRDGWLLLGAVAGSMAVLVSAQVWLARRTHRYVNVPLAFATVVAAVAGLGTVSVSAWTDRHGDQIVEGPFAATAALSNARMAAFDAKITESLTLIDQGSGAGDERLRSHDEEARRQLELAEQAGARSLTSELAEWRSVHEDIRRLDDDGRWREAVNRATGAGRLDANPTFQRFAAASEAELEAQAEATMAGFLEASRVLVVARWVVLAAGIAAALAAWRGWVGRLEEYR